MTRKLKFGIALALIAAVGGGLACARHHHPSPEQAKKMLDRRVSHVLSDIDASDAQASSVNRVTDRVFDEFLAVHQGAKGTHREMLTQWRSDQPDAEKMHALVDERLASLQKAAHVAVDGMLEVHATLEPEQRERISAKIEKRMGD